MAIVKETKNSLRWFLIIIGCFGIYSGIMLLRGNIIVLTFKSNPIVGLFYVISFIFSVITLYIGIKFFSLIQTNSKFIVNFFWIQLIFSVLATLYDILNKTFSVLSLVFVIINVLILVAIIKNVKRLSAEGLTPVPKP